FAHGRAEGAHVELDVHFAGDWRPGRRESLGHARNEVPGARNHDVDDNRDPRRNPEPPRSFGAHDGHARLWLPSRRVSIDAPRAPASSSKELPRFSETIETR